MNKKTQQQFTCKCGKSGSWIAVGDITKEPCPHCGRFYKGYYDEKKCQIVAKEFHRVKVA